MSFEDRLGSETMASNPAGKELLIRWCVLLKAAVLRDWVLVDRSAADGTLIDVASEHKGKECETVKAEGVASQIELDSRDM
ncbi:hypothetical protein HDV02_001314 [Globomyces sp. JEL0801]|nr:hypothetical protein HDV02_001314 [Globomyces sp. JEL0801]